MIDYLIELDKKVPLKELVAKGLIKWTVIRDRDIYLHFDSVLKTTRSVTKAYDTITDEWKMSRGHIERIVCAMKQR